VTETGAQVACHLVPGTPLPTDAEHGAGNPRPH